jgi:muramoyltetrapeptide carboxypeptidase LdcA involved in peptidoglycan recycling
LLERLTMLQVSDITLLRATLNHSNFKTAHYPHLKAFCEHLASYW